MRANSGKVIGATAIKGIVLKGWAAALPPRVQTRFGLEPRSGSKPGGCEIFEYATADDPYWKLGAPYMQAILGELRRGGFMAARDRSRGPERWRTMAERVALAYILDGCEWSATVRPSEVHPGASDWTMSTGYRDMPTFSFVSGNLSEARQAGKMLRTRRTLTNHLAKGLPTMATASPPPRSPRRL